VAIPDPSNPPQSNARAYLWSPIAKKIIDLQNLDLDKLLNPSGHSLYDNAAYGINNRRQIVGTVDTALAFLYDEGQVYDLNKLISSNQWTQLSIGADINDRGQIVGRGLYNNTYTGFLLTP
jgi:probable HAF family extracellular repeat protein